MAAMAVLSGSPYAAELMLLHNGMIYQAISLNLQLHNWCRYDNNLVKNVWFLIVMF